MVSVLVSTQSEAVQVRGVHLGRCDERGRLRMPALISAYLNGFGTGSVFLTTLEEGVLRVYPAGLWRRNEDLALECSDDVEAIADVMFLAHLYGADAMLEQDGSIQLNRSLREKLNFDGQKIWVDCYRGRLNISCREALDRRRISAMINLNEKLRKLQRAGLR